jgi:hypothetical protein
MKLTLEEWDELVGRHLQMIEAGAEICESHARQLFAVPDWETRASDRLQVALNLLNKATTRLASAQREMRGKNRVD